MKRKAGLQKKISSIFRNLPVDELGTDAPMSAIDVEQEQSPRSESIDLALNEPPQPVVDPPDFGLETPVIPVGSKIDLQEPVVEQESSEPASLSLNFENIDFAQEEEELPAEPDQSEKVRELTDDGLSYFSFNSEEPDTNESNPDELLEEENIEESTPGLSNHAPEPEPAFEPVVKKSFSKPKKHRDIDKRQVMTMALISVLAIVFVTMMLKAFAPSLFESKTENPSDALDLAPLSVALAKSPIEVWPKPQPYSQKLRDPMRSARTKSSATVAPVVSEASTPVETDTNSNPLFNINGIVYSEDRPSVIIGVEILFVGDVIQEATIISISKTQVTFELNDQQWTQSL